MVSPATGAFKERGSRISFVIKASKSGSSFTPIMRLCGRRLAPLRIRIGGCFTTPKNVVLASPCTTGGRRIGLAPMRRRAYAGASSVALIDGSIALTRVCKPISEISAGDP